MLNEVKHLILKNIRSKSNRLLLSFSISLSLLSCQNNIDNKHEGMVLIKTGSFEMGGDNQQAKPDEFPKHKVIIPSFWIDEMEVTNAQFQQFISETNYITTAEKDFDYTDKNGKLIRQKAGSLVFQKLDKNEDANVNNWWHFVEGANWKHPQGPYSSIEGKDSFPVVQVSWYDAMAYCKWSNKRLPTEAEWEFAARGGLINNIYTFGNDTTQFYRKINSWNGIFPYENTLLDKYEGTAPVHSFQANNYGLYNMTGNVWEWCSDWYDANYYSFCVKNAIFSNPKGPTASESGEKVMRGGSFLCNDSYCSGFRVAARMKTAPETSLEHTGFRCLKDIK